MLRRRRSWDEEQPTQGTGEAGPGRAGTGPAETGQPGTGQPGRGAAQAAARGPWDAGDPGLPDAERFDFGSILVPAAPGCEVQVSMADDQAAWVTVVRGDSGLQLQAFAAPKTGGLWAEVREEIAAEVGKAGGHSEEAAGPFGVEVRARIAAVQPLPGGGTGLHPVRFLGVDGPRWFLRGVISGPAARRDELAAPLEEVFAGVVVVRGDHPMPPRDMLEIRLPAEALQALAAQAGELAPEGELALEGEQEANRWGGLDPFARGPEITETR